MGRAEQPREALRRQASAAPSSPASPAPAEPPAVRRFSYRGPGWRMEGSPSERSSIRHGRPRHDGTTRALAEPRRPPAVGPGQGRLRRAELQRTIATRDVPYPDRPILFAKFANTVVATGDPIVRPQGTHALDLEVELGVVIGERAPALPALTPSGTSPATSSSMTSRPVTGRAARRRSARASGATASGSGPRARIRSCRSGPCS